VNPAISKYMREMQARSAASRWIWLSPAERSAKMKALRAKAKRKPKRESNRMKKLAAAAQLNGDSEYQAAARRGASQEELDAITTRHLPEHLQ
jgi:predicted Fe-S protein YdhL (DUF1289 family)